MIFADALPKIKTFLRPAQLAASTCTLVVRLIAAFVHHPGRMSATQAAGAIRSQARHRAQLVRFLARSHWSRDWRLLETLADLLLQQEARRDGTWVFILDQTYCGQQGQQTENTFSRANYRPRAKKSRRKQKKHPRRSCHGFVCGLLLTPSGLRVPCCRCYYTEDYCRLKHYTYQKQTDLAARLVEQLAVPEGATVVVLGDTAFDAACLRTACQHRNFTWIVPINPERVLAGAKPRPKILSLVENLSAEHFEAVRLLPGQGVHAAQQRAARCRLGPKAKARTYWVHPERRAVHNVGEVVLVFSTKEQPCDGRAVLVQKVLMTNGLSLSAAAVVALYALRWQVELFFKELKSTLGMAQYRFRQFTKVEGWVQACLVAFVYLEWYRVRQLHRPEVPEKATSWWRQQRCFGVAAAVQRRAEEHDLEQLLRWSGTESGRRKLRRSLKQALSATTRQSA